MFIHWGVYAVPAGEWKGNPHGEIGEWIMGQAAGMKYVVITSKHHDGFALYDSAVTDWGVMNSGAKRDLLAPLAEAVRAEGLKFPSSGLDSSRRSDHGGQDLGCGAKRRF